jgi:hypothetical protein
VTMLFELVAGEPPTEAERQAVLTFVQVAEAAGTAAGAEDPRREAWAAAVHALFASSRLQVVE